MRSGGADCCALPNDGSRAKADSGVTPKKNAAVTVNCIFILFCRLSNHPMQIDPNSLLMPRQRILHPKKGIGT